MTESEEYKHQAEVILEYMIMAFLSMFRKQLKESLIVETSIFSKFDDVFIKYRGASNSELNKFLESIHTSYLQDLLNRLKVYFSPYDIIKLNPEKLSLIGKNLIWVSIDINIEEIENIIKRLKQKSDLLFGPKLFEHIDSDIKKNLY